MKTLLTALILLTSLTIAKAQSPTPQQEAQDLLEDIWNSQRIYFQTNETFAPTFEDINYTAPAPVTEKGGTSNFTVQITYAGDDKFVATAGAVTDFDEDGIYAVWEIHENKEIRVVIED